MDKNKKVTISLIAIMSLVVIALGLAVGLVLVANQARMATNVTVSYKANGVRCDVSADYVIETYSTDGSVEQSSAKGKMFKAYTDEEGIEVLDTSVTTLELGTRQGVAMQMLESGVLQPVGEITLPFVDPTENLSSQVTFNFHFTNPEGSGKVLNIIGSTPAIPTNDNGDELLNVYYVLSTQPNNLLTSFPIITLNDGASVTLSIIYSMTTQVEDFTMQGNFAFEITEVE
ncbi:MAG: hypothetical protein IJA61_02195 [Clostridia bacterium]|nr:hypothetical protein [Clostridia bacterium]